MLVCTQAWEGTAVADAYKSNLAKEGMVRVLFIDK